MALTTHTAGKEKGGNSKTKAGAFIFLGPETGKKQDAIDDIRKKLFKQEEKPEEYVFYAGETAASHIVGIARNHSLFARERLFIVKNAEQIKKKDDVALITACMRELETGDAMILISDEFKLASGFDGAVPRENQKIFYELFENEKNEWVRSFFRREGFSIESGGVDAILEMVENNTDALRRECSRLVLFLPKDRPASAADIEQWLSHSREESAFTLFSRIAAGDIQKAVESLHTLLGAKERAQGILAGLASCFRKLRDYLALLENGTPDNFQLKTIGLSAPKAKADYAAAARRYNTNAACACLALTAEYDILTRSSGPALEALLLDVYIVKIFQQSTGRGNTTGR